MFGCAKKHKQSARNAIQRTENFIMKDLENNTSVFFLGNSYKKISKSKPILGPSASCSNFKTLNLDNLFHCKRMQRNNSDQDLFEESSQDLENGNSECASRRSVDKDGNHLLRRRKSDYSLNTDATIDLDIEEVNSNCEEKEHSFLRFLMDSIRFPRRKPSYDAFANQFINCAYTDSCRCLDCQSRYFECDDDDDDDDDLDMDIDLSGEYDDDYSSSYNDYSQQEQLYQQQLAAVAQGKQKEQTESVQRNQDAPRGPEEPQPAASKVAPGAGAVVYDMGDDVTMMAGTPVFLNYLLNHPISCAIM